LVQFDGSLFGFPFIRLLKTNQQNKNKMKSVIVATLIASAAAFAPAAQQKTSTSLNVDMTKAIGAQAPLGTYDPLGIFPDPTNADDEQFERLRWVELKHGRIAMLATVGYLTTAAGIRFPGAENIPGGFAALDNLPGMVWAQGVATLAMMEAANQNQFKAPWGMGEVQEGDTSEFMGDFRNKALDFGWDKQTDEWKTKKRAIELNQGRAAQMGILGLMVHEKLGNLDAIIPGYHA